MGSGGRLAPAPVQVQHVGSGPSLEKRLTTDRTRAIPPNEAMGHLQEMNEVRYAE